MSFITLILKFLKSDFPAMKYPLQQVITNTTYGRVSRSGGSRTIWRRSRIRGLRSTSTTDGHYVAILVIVVSLHRLSWPSATSSVSTIRVRQEVGVIRSRDHGGELFRGNPQDLLAETTTRHLEQPARRAVAAAWSTMMVRQIFVVIPRARKSEFCITKLWT